VPKAPRGLREIRATREVLELKETKEMWVLQGPKETKEM